MQPRIRFICAALLAGLMLLAGCGQKGPLYLPEKAESQEKTEPQENQDLPEAQTLPEQEAKPENRAPSAQDPD